MLRRYHCKRSWGRNSCFFVYYEIFLTNPLFASYVSPNALSPKWCLSNYFSGSYSNSLGIQCIREDVASYIERRDGIPSNSADVFLASGATEAIKVSDFLVCISADSLSYFASS